MVSLEPVQANSMALEAVCSPRISLSAEFLDEKNFISIIPNPEGEKDLEMRAFERAKNAEFEFLSSHANSNKMLTADELFFEGKLLPFWQMQQSEKLNKISLKAKDGEEEEVDKEESRVSWFVDEDPSPRPPKCTVLWKELLRLKKQRASSLSPSSSSSSSSSSLSNSLADAAAKEQKKEGSEKHVNRVKKGLERTRSASIRIRPIVNVPICTQVRSNTLPPLFPLKERKIREVTKLRK